MVRRLRGMFAFAIWDETRQRLFCARDRVGKKPFYRASRHGCFWFASKIRALLEDPAIPRDVDFAALVAYLSLQYVPYPLSAFRAIRKLPSASTLTVTEHSSSIEHYWSLDYSKKIEGVAVEELEEQLREHLREATKIRLMSEVPLGAFLSGGNRLQCRRRSDGGADVDAREDLLDRFQRGRVRRARLRAGRGTAFRNRSS
jgi:asparagine synthase (glutamine-hydrolysing)